MRTADSILISVLALLTLSFYTFLKRRLNISVIILVIAACLLRCYVSLDPYLHLWDERFHALVAKNLINHPLIPTLYDHPLLPFDYKAWNLNNIWLHKPPLPLWTMALSMKVFGVNEFVMRLPSILISTISVFLTYFIGKNFFNYKVGWLAGFFQCINGFVVEMTGGRYSTDHIDVFFSFFIELAVAFAILQKEKGKNIFLFLFALALACAIYSKWLPALIVVPIWWLLNSERGMFLRSSIQVVVTLLIVLALVLAWQLYIFHTFPKEAAWESHFNWLHITTAIEGHRGPWYFHLARAIISWNEFIWLAFIWLMWKTYQTHFPRQNLALILWITVPYLFFSIVKTKMGGYVFFIGPAMFIVLSSFWWFVYETAITRRGWRILKHVFLIAIIILSIRYSVERIKPFKIDQERSAATRTIKNLLSQIANPKTVFFNTQYHISIMFYTPFIAYDWMPSSEQIKSVEEQGYDVVIIDDGNISPQFLDDPKIKVMKF